MNLLEFSKDNPPPVGTPDAKATPFDPGKHLPRVNSKTQRWLPRSPGRFNKGQTRLPGVDATTQTPPPATSAPIAGEVKETTADALLDLPPTPPASASPADVAPGAPAPAPAATAPIPDIAPAPAPADPKAPGSPAPAPRGADASMAHDAAAELTARVVYALTGVFIGDHKRATAQGDEHKNMRTAFAAFYQHRGVAFVGTAALLLVLLAYALGDARREEVITTVKRVFARKPKPAPAAGPVVDVEPAPAAPTPPAAPSALSDFLR